MGLDFNQEEMRDRQMLCEIERRLRDSFKETWPCSSGSPRLFGALAYSMLEIFKAYYGHLQKEISHYQKITLRTLESSINPPMILMKGDDLAGAGLENMDVLLKAREFQKEMRHIFGPFYIRRKSKNNGV